MNGPGELGWLTGWAAALVSAMMLTAGDLLTGAQLAAEPIMTLEALPPGQYDYLQVEPNPDGLALPERQDNTLLLHKVGRTVIGVNRRRGMAQLCFRGFAEDNRLLNVTRIFPPYQPDSNWDFQADWLDVSNYQRRERAFTAAEQADLLTCLQVFGR
ncbi:MAG: hypothetical protein IGS38_22230 [Synechococcales cyanobacterium M58_A2018_015]|nr:hypothetical protein [Synechococcales cyanobacterium M58_A2018_015]